MQRKVIGSYPICNTPHWYKIREACDMDTGEYVMGFNYGGSFIPFSDVMRVD